MMQANVAAKAQGTSGGWASRDTVYQRQPAEMRKVAA